MSLNPSERTLRASMAAHALHARISDPSAHTAPAGRAFLERFEKQVDPDGTLTPEVRARLAEHARKAYYKGLALKSAAARRKSRAQQEVAEQADAELASSGGAGHAA